MTPPGPALAPAVIRHVTRPPDYEPPVLGPFSIRDPRRLRVPLAVSSCRAASRCFRLWLLLRHFKL